jgi:hypothetical protein
MSYKTIRILPTVNFGKSLFRQNKFWSKRGLRKNKINKILKLN